MYRLKHLAEDFIVKEKANYSLVEQGNYLLIKVTKRHKNTEDVATALAAKLHLHRKAIGYAGSKDRKAVTTQHFTIKGTTREAVEKLSINEVTIEVVGYLQEPLGLGMLKGNTFIITLRQLDPGTTISLPRVIPNYYDEQRFSSENARIGEFLVRKEFKAAVELIAKDDRHAAKIEAHLGQHPTDPVGALRQVPLPILKLYLHAFQSRLWNELLGRYIENNARGIARLPYSQGSLCFPLNTDTNENKPENKKIPLPGFAAETEDVEIEGYLNDILQMNSLTPRDFVIRQLPNLSLEGDSRDALMRVDDFSATLEDDDLFPGKKKATLTFTLGKGSYATMLVKALFAER
jgi:tRNA pseudouridine13 synthase